MKRQKQIIPKQAHQRQSNRPDGDGLLTRQNQMAKILKRPEIQNLEKEYRLFIHLLVVAGGCITGTLEQIGKEIGTAGRNIKGWLNKLKEAGMITVIELEHKQQQIQLKEPYLSAAVIEETQSEHPEAPLPIDPEFEELMTIYRTAKATGQTIEINTVKRIDYGNGQSK